MTRWQPGPPPDSSGAVVGKPAAPEAPNPDVLAELIRAAHAITRVDAAHHLLEAMARGLPLADAIKALQEWDDANPNQRIGGQA